MATRFQIFGDLSVEEDTCGFRASYEAALDLAAMGKHTEALTCYHILLAIPGFPAKLRAKALNDVGCTHFLLENWARAFEFLLQALEWDCYATDTVENLTRLVANSRFKNVLSACGREVAACFRDLNLPQKPLATVDIREALTEKNCLQAQSFIDRAKKLDLCTLQVGTPDAPHLKGSHDIRGHLSPLAEVSVLRDSKLHAGPEKRDGIIAAVFNAEFHAIEFPRRCVPELPTVESPKLLSYPALTMKKRSLFGR